MTDIASGRTDGDSWGPGSSVGATATMVAASRALASQGPEALLDDPLADPLVRAVGLTPFVRMIDGEITLDDDPLLRREALNEQIAVRTRFFDDFFKAAPDPTGFSGERAQQLSERWRRLGLDLNMSDLIYHGERSTVIEYLATHGWQVTARSAKEMYAHNGFEFPDDDMAAAFGEMSYVSAVLD